MIRHVDENDITKLQQLLTKEPLLTVRLYALLKAYGLNRAFLDFWVDTDYNLVIARLEDVFFIHALNEPDFEEIASFLEFNPYFKIAASELKTIEGISKYLNRPHTVSARNLMKCEPRTKLPEMMYKTVKHPDLKKIFSIIKTTYEGNMEFGPWYVDISHRKRHDCARVYLINDLLDSKPASACLISAESDCAGLISGVSTLPQYRGRGYATTGVIQACTDLRHDRKLPLLECYDEKRPYYEKLGFEFLLKTAELTLT